MISNLPPGITAGNIPGNDGYDLAFEKHVEDTCERCDLTSGRMAGQYCPRGPMFDDCAECIHIQYAWRRVLEAIEEDMRRMDEMMNKPDIEEGA